MFRYVSPHRVEEGSFGSAYVSEGQRKKSAGNVGDSPWAGLDLGHRAGTIID